MFLSHKAGANPAIASYNASVVNFFNAGVVTREGLAPELGKTNSANRQKQA
jgi:hypothetical protein